MGNCCWNICDWIKFVCKTPPCGFNIENVINISWLQQFKQLCNVFCCSRNVLEMLSWLELSLKCPVLQTGVVLFERCSLLKNTFELHFWIVGSSILSSNLHKRTILNHQKCHCYCGFGSFNWSLKKVDQLCFNSISFLGDWCCNMSQSITHYQAAPLHKPLGTSGKVTSVPVCVLLQRVAQLQNTRWNLFICHCQSTSQVSQTDNHPESHVTTHLLLVLNVYSGAAI